MNKEKIVIIDNVNTYGDSEKRKIGFALRRLGYSILTIGKNTDYSDYNVPYDVNENVTRVSVSFSKMKGSLGYRYPEYIGSWDNVPDEIIDSMEHLYSFIYRKVIELSNTEHLSFSILWGGMFIEPIAIRDALDTLGIKSIAIEYSFEKDKLYFDESGVIGNRHSLSKINKPFYIDKEQEKTVINWVENNYLGKQSQQPSENTLDDIKYKYCDDRKINVLLLCQCYIDTVITMDNPFFDNTLSAYEQVMTAIAKFENANLVVKLHPGDKPEYKAKIIELCNKYGYQCVDTEHNVYYMMDAFDCGITINSQSGLEMLAKGKNVLTLGDAFYDNKGFGISLESVDNLDDDVLLLISNKDLDKEKYKACLSYLYNYLFCYLISRTDDSILTEMSGKLKQYGLIEKHEEVKPKVLIIHPSPRYGGSGYYLQELAYYLTKYDCEVLVLSEGSCPPIDQGVRWKKIAFDGIRLDSKTKSAIHDFNPNVIYQVGVRTKPMRAAIEAYLSHKSLFIVQAEDDEFMPFDKHSPYDNRDLLEILDKPKISLSDVKKFVSLLDMKFTLKVLNDPNYYRWVEPAMRSVCYHIADIHTSIWSSMSERLERRFNKKSFIMPPFVTLSDYEDITLDENEKIELLSRYKIPHDSIVYFVNGTIYDYSEEFITFAKSLSKFKDVSKRKITLLIAGRVRGDLKAKVSEILRGKVFFRSLGVADNETYNKMILAADVICAPGYNDEFNKYRLSSRLVKAMAMKKPIFSFYVGLGETMSSRDAGFFTNTDHIDDWVEVLKSTLSEERRDIVAMNGYMFAKDYLDAPKVVKEFKLLIESELKESKEKNIPLDGLTEKRKSTLRTKVRALITNPKGVYYKYLKREQYVSS